MLPSRRLFVGIGKEILSLKARRKSRSCGLTSFFISVFLLITVSYMFFLKPTDAARGFGSEMWLKCFFSRTLNCRTITKNLRLALKESGSTWTFFLGAAPILFVRWKPILPATPENVCGQR